MIPLIVTRFGAMKALNLNSNDYNYCALILFLQNSRIYGKGGWTEASYKEISETLNIDKRSAKRSFDRLVMLELLEKHPKNKLKKRATLKFELAANAAESPNTFQVMTERHQADSGGDKRTPEVVTKGHQQVVTKGHQTLYIENNIETLEILKENENPKNISIPSSESVQSSEKNTPQIPPRPPKKNPLETAKEIYENARAKFLKRNGATPDKFVWTRIEERNLEKLATALKMKKQDSESWADEYEFLEMVLKPFLEMAAEVDIWWNKTFSLYDMQIKFNSFFDELNINHAKSSNTQNGKTKHLISDADTKRIYDELLEEYSGEGWGDSAGSSMAGSMSGVGY